MSKLYLLIIFIGWNPRLAISKIYDMTQETKRIHFSDQQRREAVTRLMSGVIVSEHRAHKIKKVRRNVIQQMCVAFTKAVHAE